MPLFFFFFLPVVLLAACTSAVENLIDRIPINPPPSSFALSRTTEGNLSEHDIQKATHLSRIVAVHPDKNLVTIETPDKTTTSLSTVTANLNPRRLTPGMPVQVDAYTSVIFSVINPELAKEITPHGATRLTEEAKTGLPATAVVTRVKNTVATIIALDRRSSSITLKNTGGTIVRFPIRYPENFSRIKKGDTIALTSVSAIVITPLRENS